jgi:hypothetical protein
MAKMPRVQEIVLPVLRGHNDLQEAISVHPDLAGVRVNTWIEDIDYRSFPMLTIRRVGGVRKRFAPTTLSLPVIEMTAYGNVGLPETEELYENALEALFEAQRTQSQTEAGYIHSVRETMGATQFSSLFMDSWRVQGLIMLGIRPPRSTSN